jgi:hypothetical protein
VALPPHPFTFLHVILHCKQIGADSSPSSFPRVAAEHKSARWVGSGKTSMPHSGAAEEDKDIALMYPVVIQSAVGQRGVSRIHIPTYRHSHLNAGSAIPHSNTRRASERKTKSVLLKLKLTLIAKRKQLRDPHRIIAPTKKFLLASNLAPVIPSNRLPLPSQPWNS